MMTVSPTRPAVAAIAESAQSAMGNRKAGFYRHDLDGLRGIAIALVAMFHVWFGRVSGGVDVFLALSGFFFGGKLLRAALNPAGGRTGSLSPVPEVIRLVRRLLPALVVVLAGCAVLTILIQPETRWETFADQSLASLGYYQNWELASTVADYLRAGEAVSPLQHIWSMSVQGQFYIAFLALVFGFAFLFRRRLGNRLRTTFVLLLSALAVASFVYAIFAHQANQATAYYNSFARAWELLLGVLAGALVPYIRWPMWLRTVIATVALVAVLSCGALIDGVKEFPGPWALVPVGAAVLFILAGANRYAHPTTRDQVAVAQPAAGGRAAGEAGRDGLLAVPLALAAADLLARIHRSPARQLRRGHRGIADIRCAGLSDHPVRRRPAAAPRTGQCGVRVRPVHPVAGAAAPPHHRARFGGSDAGCHAHRDRVHLGRACQRGTRQRQGANWAQLPRLSRRSRPRQTRAGAQAPHPADRVRSPEGLPAVHPDGCISDFANTALIKCTYGDKAATRTIALAGGSHAEHWLTALDILGRTHHFKVTTYLKMGCPLSTEKMPLVMGNNAPYPECRDWVPKAMAQVVADHPDYVFTTSTRPWNIKPGDVMPGTYIGIWQTFSDNNIPILAMRDTPWLVKDGQPFNPSDCLAKGGDAISCGIKRSDVLADHNPTLDFVEQFPELKPLDMSDAVCRPDICPAIEGNVLVYHDAHHLSATYMRTMTNELGRQVGAATGWW